MTATKERLHHLIDEIQESDANEVLQFAEDLKADKVNGVSKHTTSENQNNKVEWDPGIDDEVWMYVC